MSLLVKARAGRDIVGVTPEQAGWRYVGFSAHRLNDATPLAFSTGAREYCVVVLSGVVSVRAGTGAWLRIGRRASVFEDCAPFALYLPQGQDVHIEAHGAAEVALCSAPAAADGSALPARLITPEKMARTQRGSGSNTRYVCDILPASEPAAHLLVVEVRTPAGHSSSYPPHKHDADSIPAESVLEETYYHKIDPPQGFALQRVYTDDRSLDQTMSAEDGDVVMVPRGYHPVVMPHGYQGYYLNVMAGPVRAWHFRNDPAHEWMLAPRPDVL
jgi:5-deoxy-glucuronate isomerase